MCLAKLPYLVTVTQAESNESFFLNINRVDMLQELAHDTEGCPKVFKGHIEGSTTVMFKNSWGAEGNKIQINENISWFHKQGLLNDFIAYKHAKVEGIVAVNMKRVIYAIEEDDNILIFLPCGSQLVSSETVKIK